MTTHGLQLYVDTEAAKDDADNLMAYAKAHFNAVKRLGSTPDDILLCWGGASARKNMGILRTQIQKMPDEYDRLMDLAKQLAKTAVAFEFAEDANKRVAEHYYDKRGGAGSERAEQAASDYGWGKPSS